MDTQKFFCHVHYDPVWKSAAVFKGLQAAKNMGIFYKKPSLTFSEWKQESDSINKTENRTEEWVAKLYPLL